MGLGRSSARPSAAHFALFEAVPQFRGGMLSTFYVNYFRSTSVSISNHHMVSRTGQGRKASAEGKQRKSSRVLVPLAKRHASRLRVGGCELNLKLKVYIPLTSSSAPSETNQLSLLRTFHSLKNTHTHSLIHNHIPSR
jgi:hypothetical protein